jgi:hypothetical protein
MVLGREGEEEVGGVVEEPSKRVRGSCCMK